MYSTDYIYAPKTAQGGNSAALVIIDHLTTSWVHAEPVVSTQSASSTCLVLFKYICQYGCPEQVITDNGVHFTASEIQQYIKNTFDDIHINFGPSHRPQRQGRKVERANRTLKSILKKYVWEYVADWDIFLPAALFAMRTMIKIDGAYSPFILTYGRPPRISALKNEDLLYLEEEVDQDAVLKRIAELVYLNRNNVIPEATNKMKAQYDKTAKNKTCL
ncbi:hypothetical protein MAM1_0009c01025 [Mucor ambiguus]|uniref:Integrase catalytic domain-containing protein n=1 Tax=Mucor ambiguus TaxID=91626 RepID=A0A0C9M0G9_9FUNG|nr:hypothetical protein MAM1_0009c01025 [Mucor ambiguus]